MAALFPAEKVQQPCPRLSEQAAKTLPDARVYSQRLPQCPALALYLLDADYPQHLLDDETILRLMDEPSYWAFCWASGQVMARYLLDAPHWVAGKRVLDFGCGSGVAAIAAAKAGAAHVVACDIDPVAQLATARNAELNGVELDICGDFFAYHQPIDIILVADVLYDRENMPLLAEFARRAKTVLLADSRVRNLTVEPYRKRQTFESSTIPDLDESREFNQVNIYSAQYEEVASDGAQC
ncbi:putative nicotinamide N-methyase [Sinobacterium caligoides]|uniref:Putative nicotinamide N-methyase n=1 Tax=Sinobacterium caligoides TaxID=933926 RepID=A0A3N2E1D4_9GAMM|nr:50S ribosomal protein L11 methyltransferase [Sinobacterium caligoides]ROS05742.1 putative nicotinamide N-methyase [Sinobacterium caligoides]